jgi:predicted ATPase/class 3 adenylate cyclase/DNA-binding CsgD family transcriptional regulator
MTEPRVPVGTVTLLLADVEGSTRLWEAEPETMTEAVARLDEVVAAVVSSHGGVRPVEQGEGDSFVVAFTRASEAVATALDLQRADTAPIRLRIGIHTGEVQLRDEANYIGPAINRTARLRNIAHGGQAVLSQAAHDLVVDRLPEGAFLADLGVHRLRDLARPERVYQLCHPDLPTEFPPLRSLDAYPHNLPVQLTSFVGRQAELEVLRALLADTRLLTLTGSGGSGKTRLALQVAAEVLPEFADGVWLVDLAPITGADAVASAVEHVMGLQDEPSRSTTETITHHIGTKSVLLVLDNCEHLITACATLADSLLRACPSLVILATSREPVDVAGEMAWRVPSLSLPDGDGPAETGLSSEAVELFVDRARRARPEFRLTEANALAVEQICRRLDGIPLAIELAAARVRVLSAPQIASGLDDRFNLLTGGARTAVPRQQTLRASVDWSHALLTEPERTLFRRLAAFAGSFDFDAAQVIAADSSLAAHQVLDQLAMLVDKSLVVIEEREGELRYRLLETVRHYALEQLEGSGEEADARRRHRDHYLGVVDTARQRVVGPEQDQWLDVLALEFHNLRAAFEWSRNVGDTEAAVFLAVALEPLWWMRGYWGEGGRWLDAALADPGELSPPLRALALASSGAIAGQSYDPKSVALAEEALALAHGLGDDGLLALVLRAAGTAFYVVDVRRAVTLFTEAIALARELDDKAVLAMTLQTLSATLLATGDPAAAIAAADEGLALASELQSPYLVRWIQVVRGRLLAMSDVVAARSLLHEVAAEARAVGDRTALVMAQAMEAETAAMMGEAEIARPLAVELLATSDDMGSTYHQAIVRWSVANVELAAGDAVAACRAFAEGWDLLGGAAGIADLLLGRWSEAELVLGDIEAARKRADDGVTRAEAGGFKWQLCWALRAAARVAAADGDVERAEVLAHRALALGWEVGDSTAEAEVLELVAALALAHESYDEAARLFGAAEAFRHQIKSVRPGVFSDWYGSTVAALRDAMGDEALARAWKEGAALSLEEAVAYTQRGRGERRRPSVGWASLTPAELDVARLVGEGLANKDIAAKLFISPRTVQAHLTHIYAKLGVGSRVGLAREVTRRS